MPRSLLLGLDGSPDSAAALETALAFARRFDCLLVGLGVIDEPGLRGEQPLEKLSASYQKTYARLLESHRRKVEHTLELFASRCAAEQIACKLLEDTGAPRDQILLEAQRYDLILLGCRTHFEFGSQGHCCKTLEHVVRGAPRPVIAVPSPGPLASETPAPEGAAEAGLAVDPSAEHAPGASPLARVPPPTSAPVVAAYDGSLPAARALQAFVGSGLAALGPLHLACVHNQAALEAARALDRAREFLRFHEIEATPHALEGSDCPSRAFLSLARELSAGLVVMGAYGRPRLTEYLFGSTTRAALRHSPAPLFLYH